LQIVIDADQMDSAAVLQQLTSLVGAALKMLSAIRDAGHLASPNSQQNKNETARVLPLNMAVSKSLDKGLANCLWSLPLSIIKFIVSAPARYCP